MLLVKRESFSNWTSRETMRRKSCALNSSPEFTSAYVRVCASVSISSQMKKLTAPNECVSALSATMIASCHETPITPARVWRSTFFVFVSGLLQDPSMLPID